VKRSGFKTPEARASLPLIRKRKCKSCGESFRPFSSLVKWCSPECGAKLAQELVAKKAAKAAAEDRKQTRAQLEALKTIPQLKKEAQREFNRFIRARDCAAQMACICCAKPLEWGTKRITGSAVDAGHYRSTGSADHLRFHEDNCHAQRVVCNQHGGGRAVDYRIGLIARIGLERVEALEANNTPIKGTREGLRAIRDEYRQKAKALEMQQ